MKEFKIEVPEEKVDKIQELDCKVQSMQTVLTNLFDMHALDTNTKFISSPMVQEYQKQIIDAQKEFEKAKDELVNEFIDEETQKKVTNWELNYSNCRLVYTTNEN